MIPSARPLIGEEELFAISKVIDSNNLAQGNEVYEFENEYSKIAVENANCIAVNSGTSALHLTLLAADIGPGDEVIVPSFTFAATANSVALTGAKPIFVDIESDYFCIDPIAIQSKITNKTKAIMPVHLYGHPANMPAIQKIADKFGLIVIEDSAQAHLASIHGKKVGTWGLAGAFSFYPTKNMTSGEGGMVSTFSSNIAKKIKLLRNQGQEQRYKNEIIGFNNRMTNIHAAIGRVQLKKLLGWTEIRKRNASFYNQNLVGVVKPLVMNECEHVYHQYTIKILDHNRDRFAEELNKLGVGSGVYYPTPTHRLPAYNLDIDLPITEKVSKEVLSIPIYPSLTQKELEKIVMSVNKVANAGVGNG